MRLPRRMAWVVWTVLSAVIVVALVRLPWQRAAALLRLANLWWLLAAAALNATILGLWAAQWRLLVPSVSSIPYRRMLEIVTVTASVLNTIPFFAGETSAFALLVARGGLTVAGAASVLALDQLLVGIGKIAVIVAAAVSAPLPTWLRAGVLAFSMVIVLMTVTMTTLAHRWSADGPSPNGCGVWSRTRAFVVGLGRDLDALRSAHRTTQAVILSFLKKAAELGAILAVQNAFGVAPSFPAAALVLAALGLSTIVPVTPSNVGVYEATVFAVYRYLGVPSETALALAAAQHVCFLVPSVGVGYLTLTVQHLRFPALRRS